MRDVSQELRDKFGESVLASQTTRDGIPTIWISPDQNAQVMNYLKTGSPQPYTMLYDLTAIDERSRSHREDQPASDFTVVYYLISLERNEDLRIKVPLKGETPSLRTITGTYRNANWYEREVWDMFGIKVEGHPHLERILMPRTWQGHPLRKEHPARATEMGQFRLPDEKQEREEEALKFHPERWGLKRHDADSDFMFLNLGPQHPGVHGVLRLVLQLDGEIILDVVPEIGFHHRAAEKMGERQSWHTYIPYTDRVDYLSGVLNNFPYVLTVEKLAGIEVPARAQIIRIMMSELFRIANHIVWFGTFAQDVGQMSPVFYMFSDRERIFDIVSAVTGGRMHPSWFRIGGVSQDLPNGWDKMVREFVESMPSRLDEYEKTVMQNGIFKARTKGIGCYTLEEAIEWGVTGPNLRACGLDWDMRKKRPYSGFENFDFDIPTATHGDSYDRGVVRVEEIRQSLRIITQCLENMPSGPYKAEHPQATPPPKERTMFHIETLIDHFLNVSWGPVIPPGEACLSTENAKGMNGYYLISDGNTECYRTRIRTPSFPHMQSVPAISRGLMIPDLIAILGSIDFVMADIDR